MLALNARSAAAGLRLAAAGARAGATWRGTAGGLGGFVRYAEELPRTPHLPQGYAVRAVTTAQEFRKALRGCGFRRDFATIGDGIGLVTSVTERLAFAASLGVVQVGLSAGQYNKLLALKASDLTVYRLGAYSTLPVVCAQTDAGNTLWWVAVPSTTPLKLFGVANRIVYSVLHEKRLTPLHNRNADWQSVLVPVFGIEKYEHVVWLKGARIAQPNGEFTRITEAVQAMDIAFDLGCLPSIAPPRGDGEGAQQLALNCPLLVFETDPEGNLYWFAHVGPRNWTKFT